jgi:hypothetical protein
MEYLVSSNLNIHNQGNKPTFVISNRKEVTDLTLGTDWIGNLVRNWHVSDDPPLSDYRYILFQTGNIEITRVTFHDPKRTGWKSYEEDVIVNLEAERHYAHSVQGVELAVDWLQQSILSSCYRNCLFRVAHSPRSIPWWSKELRGLKAQTRMLALYRAKMTGEWGPYKQSLTCFNKEIRKAKGLHGGGTARGFEDVPGSARLIRIMVKQANNGVSLVKLPDGPYAQTGRQTLLELCRVSFPDSRLSNGPKDGQGQSDLGGGTCRANREDWNLVKRIINQSKIKWAISTFKPFKSARTDGTVPALL